MLGTLNYAWDAELCLLSASQPDLFSRHMLADGLDLTKNGQ